MDRTYSRADLFMMALNPSLPLLIGLLLGLIAMAIFARGRARILGPVGFGFLIVARLYAVVVSYLFIVGVIRSGVANLLNIPAYLGSGIGLLLVALGIVFGRPRPPKPSPPFPGPIQQPHPPQPPQP